MDISLIGALVIGLVSATVGAVVGGGSVLVALRSLLTNIRNDAPLLSAIERLGSSVPADVLSAVNTGADDLALLADILKQVTDGLPNVSAGAKAALNEFLMK